MFIIWCWVPFIDIFLWGFLQRRSYHDSFRIYGVLSIFTFLHTSYIYVCMIYIWYQSVNNQDGGSLANVLTQVGPLPEKILACITFQVLWGLAYMKCEKRVHRDIKPSNLLINSQGFCLSVFLSVCFYLFFLCLLCYRVMIIVRSQQY